MSLLEIQGLKVQVEDQEILQGVDLCVEPGQIHAIMGPNGAGKSTLAKVLGGHPDYEVLGGALRLEGEDLLELEPEERAAKGLFMSFQYPVEIPGVSNLQFLHASYSAVKGKVSLEEFEPILDEKMAELQVPAAFKERAINEGFSGGEKKRNEILQMAVLDPKVAILDETDSGLDIDALRTVAEGVKALMNEKRGLILITHYQRLLDYIEPDHVHVMKGGRLVESGGPELAHKLEKEGYDWLK